MWHLCMLAAQKCLSFTLIAWLYFIRNVLIIGLADYWGQSLALPVLVSVFFVLSVDKLIQLKMCYFGYLLFDPLID